MAVQTMSTFPMSFDECNTWVEERRSEFGSHLVSASIDRCDPLLDTYIATVQYTSKDEA